MKKEESLVGRRFTRLLVLEETTRTANYRKWKCICDCGTITIVAQCHLLAKNSTKSCGCYAQDRNKEYYKKLKLSKPIPSHAMHMWTETKKKCKYKNIAFDIQVADIKIPEECPILGISFCYEKWSEYAPSLDRVNPKLGYIKGNICVISKRANRLKQDCLLEELQKLVDYVASFSDPTIMDLT